MNQNPHPITREFLTSHGFSLATANYVMEEIERLESELADVKNTLQLGVNHSVELAGRLEKLGCTKAERDEFETQLMNAHKLVANAMKREATLRGALVRLCNSWAEGTERENYEAMKEAKAAISGDVGRDFISREQVKPLVAALEKAENAIQRSAGINDETRLGWALKDVDAALKHARTLGFSQLPAAGGPGRVDCSPTDEGR